MVCGGTLTIALFCMDDRTLKDFGVHGIVTRSEQLGRAIRCAKDEAAAAGMTPEQYFLSVTGGHKLFKGKITDVLRETRGAFNFGRVVLEGIGDYRGSSADVEFQNENLCCTVDGDIMAATTAVRAPTSSSKTRTSAARWTATSWPPRPTSSAWWTPRRSRPSPPMRSSTASA